MSGINIIDVIDIIDVNNNIIDVIDIIDVNLEHHNIIYHYLFFLMMLICINDIINIIRGDHQLMYDVMMLLLGVGGVLK